MVTDRRGGLKKKGRPLCFLMSLSSFFKKIIIFFFFYLLDLQ